ncbi:hypothetical protein G9444_3473 [Rhodococcus erythropolis]|uniref:Uncharacterized protein n=1 Tax=Rhodococcus erythropolis TaxID=1833 RepID=A0A6G9CUP3_RHOER|nr:hypothetical protein G9444_3473 [Rhodococcus erythropolis]
MSTEAIISPPSKLTFLMKLVRCIARSDGSVSFQKS